MKQSYFLTAVKISLTLLLICAVIAGAVSFVFSISNDTYEANVKKEKDEAISKIFSGEAVQATKINTPADVSKNVKEIYEVKAQEVLRGYCINIVGKGFGGEINLMIGYNAFGNVEGVKVIGHSETPGVGTKVIDNDSWLAKFSGTSGAITFNKKADAVTGATISSKAVTAAVSEANETIQKVIKGGIA